MKETVISKKWLRSFREDGKNAVGRQTVKRSAMITGFSLMLWPRQAIRWRRISAKLTISVVDGIRRMVRIFIKTVYPIIPDAARGESAINAEAIVTYYETYGH